MDDSWMNDPIVSEALRRKVRRMTWRGGSEPADCEQTLLVEMSKALRRYEPRRGVPRHLFLTCVISRAAAGARRSTGRRLRNLPTQSLDHAGEEVLADDDEWMTASDRAADVAAFLAALPSDLRDLAERLQYATLAEIARETKTPRSTLQRRIRKMRDHYADENLREYL